MAYSMLLLCGVQLTAMAAGTVEQRLLRRRRGRRLQGLRWMRRSVETTLCYVWMEYAFRGNRDKQQRGAEHRGNWPLPLQKQTEPKKEIRRQSLITESNRKSIYIVSSFQLLMPS
jgi:hypothetical protein